jgi:hypothetical protein
MRAEKCTECDEPIVAPGFQYCELHQDEYAKANRAPDWTVQSLMDELEDNGRDDDW